VSTEEFLCTSCDIVVDDRGCPRCWWKTPLPKLKKRTKLTVAQMGGGLPPPGPPSAALAGSGAFIDDSQNTRTLVINSVACPAGGSLLIGVTYALAGNDAVFSVEWNGVTYPRTDFTVKRREEYDDNTLSFLQSWLITRPGSGTHNLTIAFDPFSTAPTSTAAIVVAIGPGPSSGDPLLRPPIGDITTDVSHCTSTTFLQYNTDLNAAPYPYTTTSLPGPGPFDNKAYRHVAFCSYNGTISNFTGEWSTGLTRLTKAGTSLPIADSHLCALDCATFTTNAAGNLLITRTGFVLGPAVISLDSFRP
jgi:hypothetical protein